MSKAPNAAELAVVRDLLASVADEMAFSCMRTALSPNIRDRRDLSAALFDAEGTMLAHAAHNTFEMRSVVAARSSSIWSSFGSSALTATARWLIAFFSSSRSSAMVRSPPAITKRGS